jgi:hypothetical protein
MFLENEFVGLVIPQRSEQVDEHDERAHKTCRDGQPGQ